MTSSIVKSIVCVSVGLCTRTDAYIATVGRFDATGVFDGKRRRDFTIENDGAIERHAEMANTARRVHTRLVVVLHASD